jgi:hypothetical protein
MGNRTEKAPASSRGWILQERILAPRVIHFGPNQILWECRELAATEVYPSGIPQSGALTDYNLKAKIPQITEANKPFAATTIMRWWGKIVDKYSNMNLTQPDDKLPALSGIAKEMERLLIRTSPNSGGVRYLAGLWDINFLEQLLWRSYRGGTRPAKYRAPSWSWASVDGNVSYDNTFGTNEGSTVATVTEVNVDLVTADPMGQLTNVKCEPMPAQS